MSKLTVPGKIFLMGEYGVIEGGKALLLALKPGFSYVINEDRSDAHHEASPIEQYFKKSGARADVFLEDPGLSAGFGGSTAELIAGAYGVATLAHLKAGKLSNTEEQGEKTSTFPGKPVSSSPESSEIEASSGARSAAPEDFLPPTESFWADYKKSNPSASGADLVVQLEALKTGQSSYYVSRPGHATPFPKSVLLNQIFMFAVEPNQKLPTHEDLKKRRSVAVGPLDERVLELREVLRAENELGLEILTSFASDLSRLFLETSLAHAVRHAFQDVHGVLGVKGCGAGLNDVFLVAIRRRDTTRALEECKAVAEKHHLRFLGTLGEHAW